MRKVSKGAPAHYTRTYSDIFLFFPHNRQNRAKTSMRPNDFGSLYTNRCISVYMRSRNTSRP